MVCWVWEWYLFILTCWTLPLPLELRFVLPPLYVCLCAFFFFLPISPPLRLQFQPSVQLVGRGSQEAGGGGPGKCQVQRTHLSDSAVRQEEEQRPAAAAKWQKQSLWFSQRGVSHYWFRHMLSSHRIFDHRCRLTIVFSPHISEKVLNQIQHTDHTVVST